MSNRLNAAEHALSTGTISKESERKFATLQKQVNALPAEKKSTQTDGNSDCTIVCGNFKNTDGEKCEILLFTEIEKLC